MDITLIKDYIKGDWLNEFEHDIKRVEQLKEKGLGEEQVNVLKFMAGVDKKGFEELLKEHKKKITQDNSNFNSYNKRIKWIPVFEKK